VQIDLAVSNHLIDVIDSGFDAGIRYGGTVPEIWSRSSCQPTSVGWLPHLPHILSAMGFPDILVT
jgi:hypothetical protein